MMNEYILSCCSTADLTRERFERRNISVICFHYEIDGVQYSDDFGTSIPYDEFYRRMTEGAITKTSQINVEEYETYFEGFLKQGKDILHVSLSSGITGTINSAMLARDLLLEKYPDRKIYLVDSLCASSGYGLFMDKLADLRDEGKTIEQVRDFAEEHKLNVQHWFFSTDLTFFIRGGRISKTAGTIGNVLGICPLMNVDHNGKLIPREKIRGEKKSIRRTVEKMKELATDGVAYSGKCYLCHSASPDTARKLADLIEETFPNLDGNVEIYHIGTTIGSHTGPGTVSAFFWGAKRED